MTSLAWEQVCARRLERHALLAPAADAAEAARRMCGVHAQVPSAAELSLGLRLEGATRSDVWSAVWDDRTLIRTHGPRGTVHLLAAEDLPMWTGALAAVPAASSFAADVRLDEAQTDTVVAAVADAVADAELSLTELDDAVAARAGGWAAELAMPAFGTMWPRWRQVLTVASHRGAVCFGRPAGRTVTYTSPQRWRPGFAPLPPEQAVAALLRDYLHAYGPATPAHFARWLAAPETWAAAVFARHGDAIEPVRCDGWTGWVNAGDTAPASSVADGLWMLPYFDAYGVGAQPRAAVFPGRASERALARGQAGNFPVLLIDGGVAGVWHSARRGARLSVTVEPLRRLSRPRRAALDDAVARIGAIAEAHPELTIGTVTVGPHA